MTDIQEAVREAMQDAWNDICADTSCHPLDLEHGRGKRLTFKPGHWADAVASRLANRISADATREPDDEHYRRCTHCGFIVDVRWKAEFPSNGACLTSFTEGK